MFNFDSIFSQETVRQLTMGLVPLVLLTISALHSIHVSATTLQGPDRLLLTTHKWPPYQTHQNNQMQGFALEKVKCALGEMGQPYKLTMTDWSEAQLHVHSGAQHGFFVSPQSDEHDSYATLSNPIAEQNLRWYFGTGVTPNLDELAKLNLKFSSEFGSASWFWLKRNGYNVVKQPRDAKVLLSLLKQREIDVALEDELVFRNELSAASLPLDYFQSQVFATKPMGVYFSHRFLSKYSGFLSAFNYALTKCEG
ncbi:transporter substrate-binding domain-containing protein [Vibrio sp. LaRot3]|nr:transporter substrate-binding domain-containing protein [Vibrio sp. LaRot3]MDA0149656.1 transporter substrate-binding domain-containing protein [Vibrio sp. LaRot3]